MRYFLFFIFVINLSIAQQRVGYVFEDNSSNPLPYATVRYGSHGVITNEEGKFIISTENISGKDSLKISYIGFETFLIPIDNWKKDTLYLKPITEKLDEVFIFDKAPDANTIMGKVIDNLDKNYNPKYLFISIFNRDVNRFRVLNMDMNIDKATFLTQKERAELNESLDTLKKSYQNVSIPTFSERFYKAAKDSSDVKWQIEKYILLKNKNKAQNFKDLLLQMGEVYTKKLDASSTYKMKSGWFTLEDSLAIKEMYQGMDSIRVKDFKMLVGKSYLENFITPKNYDVIKRYKDYNFEYKGLDKIDGKMVYHLYFYPDRRRAKFKGDIYIDLEDYAILRLSFDYAEGKSEGQNFKWLFGYKFKQYEKSTLITYRKLNDTSYYVPYYLKQYDNQYYYINRNIKFIENKARKERNYSKLDIMVEVKSATTMEYLFVNAHIGSQKSFNEFQENKAVPIEHLDEYKDVWDDYPILAPIKEMVDLSIPLVGLCFVGYIR